jgi:HEAT repeat protein
MAQLGATDEAALLSLVTALGHPDGFARRAVALALESLEPADPVVLDRLCHHRDDPDPIVSKAVTAALSKGPSVRVAAGAPYGAPPARGGRP